MSHHLDSPLARRDTRLDITDLYVFRGEIGTVFVLDVNSSPPASDAPEGFHPRAQYEFKIDLDGDAVEDLAYRFTFSERDSSGHQMLELHHLAGLDARDHAAAGSLVVRGSTGSQITGEGGLRLWAGRTADPFYVEPTVLGAIRAAVKNGTRVDLSGWRPENAVNVFAEWHLDAIVLEVPDRDLENLLGPDRRIGVWGTTTMAADAGGWQPTNRAGKPMIQPIFNPDDSQRASDYNTTRPADDPANYGALFAGLVARVVAAHGTAEDPRAYGQAVAELLLPDVLPYRIGTPACYGFATRNGRALLDNAPEMMFSLVTNSALSIGLIKRYAAGASGLKFPYVPAVAEEHAAVSA
jgi:hypothetical protein